MHLHSLSPLFCAALVCLSTLPPMSANAEPVETSARAQAIDKYQRGSKAFAARQFKDAIDLFLAADELVPSGALAFNIALAYEEMGDSSRALQWAREYLRRSPSANDEADVERRVAGFERKLRERGVQQVTIASSPAGATVRIDGRAVGVSPFTIDLPPGPHRLSLELAGHAVSEGGFDLSRDHAETIERTLVRHTEPDAPTPLAPPVRSGVGVPGIVIGGIGVLAGGVIAGGVAIGLEVARADKETSASSAPSQLSAADALAQMEDLQLGARIAVGVGAGLALAGGTMLIVGLITGEREPPVSVGAACFDGCFASLSTQF
jgi:hypothetical protein